MKIKNLFFAAMTLFAFAACTETPDAPYAFPGVEEEGTGSSAKGNPYINETFETGLGNFTTQQTVGNFPWKWEEYNGKTYAKVSGFANSSSQNAESWLISPSIDLSKETKAFISFDYVINKGDVNAAATNHKVLITDNYTGDVKTTQWTEIDFGAINDNTWAFKSTGEIELPASVIGKNKVVIAFKYISTTATSSTWEMNNLIVNGEVGAPEGEKEDENDKNEEGTYINESFASSLGVFKSQETVGNYPWVIEYSTAKITSYESDTKTNNDAKSWLISSPVDFSKETEAYVEFEYIIQYANNSKLAEYHQLLISSDYTKDAAAATWVNIPYGVTPGGKTSEGKVDWQTFSKAKVAVPAEFIGKSGVTFALCYTGTSEKASTWEVKNFVVAHGAATGGTPEEPETPNTPVVPSGDNLLANGSFEDWNDNKPAYWATLATSNATIAQSSDAHSGSSSVVVSGTTSNKRFASQSYVLAPGTYTFSAYVKNNGAEAGHCCLGYTKIVNGIAAEYNYETPAASEGGTEWSARVYEFTLTEQTELALVIMNNKTGNGASFLVDDASLTTADGYIVGGDDNEGGNDSATGAEYLNEPFYDTLGSFTTKEVIGNYGWKVDASYHYAKVSGFANSASQNAESWLISPAIDLTGETAANIAFDFVINKGDASAAAKNHKLLVTSNYTGDVTTTEWVEVEYGAVNNNNWTFNNTGNIALPQSVMNKGAVVVAFKYMSTTANSSTWEVKNVVVSSATK